jgi:hypothetical protein
MTLLRTDDHTDPVAPGVPASSPERAAAPVIKALEQRPEVLNPGGQGRGPGEPAAPRLAQFAPHLLHKAMPESAPEAWDSRAKPR